MEDQTIVTQESPNYLMPVMTMQAVIQRRAAVVEFTAKAMKRGIDFGVIPGTGDKPTLLKPGAEKLCTLFGLSPRFAITNKIEDWNGRDYDGEPMFYYTYKCGLWYQDHLVAEGEGSCNSHEKKYRYRDSKRKCPSCGKETIIKGKAEYGGGWLCFKKAGGCGAKFEDADDRITYQQIGPVLNPDIADQVNTIQKMAQKRALIAATLLAVNASEFFTQDLDDMTIEQDMGPAWTEPTTSPTQEKKTSAQVNNAQPAMIEWTVDTASSVSTDKGLPLGQCTPEQLELVSTKAKSEQQRSAAKFLLGWMIDHAEDTAPDPNRDGAEHA